VITFTSAVSIRRPPADVYTVLTDFEGYLAQWAKGPIAAVKLSAGATAVGTRFTVTAKVGPFRVRSPYEVLLWEPPDAFSGRGVAGPVRFDEEYHLSVDGGITRVEQTIHAQPRGAFRLARSVIEKQLRQLIPADLERLRVLLEASAQNE
jgi:hypothetical protein